MQLKIYKHFTFYNSISVGAGVSFRPRLWCHDFGDSSVTFALILPANPSFGHQYYIKNPNFRNFQITIAFPLLRTAITIILYSPSQLTKLLSVATPTMQSDVVLQPAATSVGLPWSCSGPPDRLCQCTVPCGPTHRHR